MTTVTADERKRVRIPDAQPGQVFTCVNNGNGSYTLTPIQPETKERFPRGSGFVQCQQIILGIPQLIVACEKDLVVPQL